MMNLLRATVHNKGGWWELRLLDLNVVADGDSEAAMLRELEYTLTAEYHLAVRQGQTPFIGLLTECAKEQSQHWEDDGKKFRSLTLPEYVSVALSAVFGRPSISAFNVVEAANTNGAKAA